MGPERITASPGWASWRRRDVTPAGIQPNAGRVDKQPVGARPSGRPWCRRPQSSRPLRRRPAASRHHALQHVQRQPFFQDKAGGQRQRLSADHGHVVDRAAHRQPANVAAGEEQRPDDVRIGASRQTRTGCTARSARRRRRAARSAALSKAGQEQTCNQIAAESCPRAMAEHDHLAMAERGGADGVFPAAGATMGGRGMGLTSGPASKAKRAVAIVGGAGALGRDHGGAQRRDGRALAAKGRAFVRLLQPLQDLARRCTSGDSAGGMPATAKRLLGVEFGELWASGTSRCADEPDAAPLAVAGSQRPAAITSCAGRLPLEGDGALRRRSPPRPGRLPTAGRPARMPRTRSTGSKPVTTMGTRYWAASGGYSQ